MDATSALSRLAAFRAEWFAAGPVEPAPIWFGARKPKFRRAVTELVSEHAAAVVWFTTGGTAAAALAALGPAEQIRVAIYLDQMSRNAVAVGAAGRAGIDPSRSDPVALALAEAVDAQCFCGDTGFALSSGESEPGPADGQSGMTHTVAYSVGLSL